MHCFIDFSALQKVRFMLRYSGTVPASGPAACLIICEMERLVSCSMDEKKEVQKTERKPQPKFWHGLIVILITVGIIVIIGGVFF